jgi:hypothetical protein
MDAHAIDAVVASKVPHGSSFGGHIVGQLVEASHSSSEIAHGDEVMLQVLFAVVALGLIGVPVRPAPIPLRCRVSCAEQPDPHLLAT